MKRDGEEALPRWLFSHLQFVATQREPGSFFSLGEKISWTQGEQPSRKQWGPVM